MNGKLITPGAMSIPAQASVIFLQAGGQIEPLSLRDLYILVALHAFCSSGGATLSLAQLAARRAVEIADATLEARAAQGTSPANPGAAPAS